MKYASRVAFSSARGESLSGIRYLFTFTPFEELPALVRDAYRCGNLHLLPFPGSLLYFHRPSYQFLRRELPFAEQIPLLHAIDWFRSGFFETYQPHWLDRRYLLITVLLAVVATFLVQQSRRLLLGESVSPEILESIREIVRSGA